MEPSPESWQRVLWGLAAVGVGVVVARQVLRRFGMQMALEQAERDEQQALRDPLRAKVQARRKRPEWRRRLEALWVRGERIRKKQQRAA